MNHSILIDMAAEYLENKEIRDFYDSLMKDISKKIDTMMDSEDLMAFKSGNVSISMVNGARMSMSTFKTKLLECGVAADAIAKAEELSQPVPNYSPRVSLLKNPVQGTTITKKGEDQ